VIKFSVNSNEETVKVLSLYSGISYTNNSSKNSNSSSDELKFIVETSSSLNLKESCSTSSCSTSSSVSSNSDFANSDFISDFVIDYSDSFIFISD